MKRIKHTLTLGITTCLILFMLFMILTESVYAEQSIADGTEVSYTSKTELTGSGDLELRVFKVVKNGKTYNGTCAQIGTPNSSSGKATATKVSNNSRHAKLIYHYAYEKDWWTGPHADDSAKNELGLDFSVKTTKRALVEYMNQISVQGSDWKSAAQSNAGFTESFAKTIYNYVTGLDVSGVKVPDSFELYFCNAGSSQNFSVWDYSPEGYLKIKKKAAESDVNYLEEAPVNYTLEGAVYYIYTDQDMTKRARDLDGNKVELTTKKNGNTEKVALEEGTYYAKEISASKGFMLDTDLNSGKGNKIVVNSSNTKDDTAVIGSRDPPTYGELISLRKTDETGRNGWKKLIGAEYTLRYYDAEPDTKDVTGMTAKRTWVFKTVKKTFENGEPYAGIDFAEDEPTKESDFFYLEGEKRVMPCGVFTIEETKAPSGLARNTTIYYGRVRQPENGAAAETVMDVKMNKDMRIEVGTENDVVNDELPQGTKIVIDKRNASTGKNKARESEDAHSPSRFSRFTSLAGAVYEVYFDDNDLALPELVGTIVTDENGHGELTKRETGDARFVGDDLPLGDYLIKEVKPASGFVTDAYVFNEKGRVQELAGDSEIEVICDYDDKGKAITKLIKGRFKDGRHLFKTRAETIDTKQITYTVISGDEPTRTYIKKTDISTGKELPGARLQIISLNTSDKGAVIEEWVSTSQEHIAWELPNGKYMLREITAPYGYDVAEDVEFEIKANNIVTEVLMQNKPITIETNASDKATASHHGVIDEEAAVIDRVKISGLYAGRRYLVKGKLTDKATGEAVKDKDGNEAIADAELTAEGDSAEIELEFKVDASGFSRDMVTVGYERIYRTSPVHTELPGSEASADALPIELAKHEDPDAEVQSIHYGGIASTKAFDKNSKDKNILAGDDVIITDLVEYRNLSIQETYTIEGELFDKTSGELTGIKASATFQPKAADGVYALEFRFDATSFEGHTLVAYETLSVKSHVVSVHENPDDEEQTVYIPKIRTKAGKPDGKKVIDTVKYKNLIPNRRYMMVGYFVDRESGKKIRNSDGMTEFTPETPNGSVKVKLYTGRAKSDVVAYEYCYLITKENGSIHKTLVGSHEDITDKKQTVEIKKKGRSTPKTGDDNNKILLYWASVMLSAMLLIVLRLRRIIR